MQIVCPNCDTSYDVNASAFGPQGRTVRCVRCRETWLARAEEPAIADAYAEAGTTHSAEPQDQTFAEPAAANSPASVPAVASLPEVESPPIAHDPARDIEWTEAKPAFGQKPEKARSSRIPRPKMPKLRISLPVAAAAMAGLCIALVIWRQDVVRGLPQTAGFFDAIRMPVNLRPMAFRDVTITTETVNGAKVYLIEGVIAGTAKTPVDIPRLRFVVSDDRGKEIYAWNAQPEEPVLQPGAQVSFKSRLASPPEDARNVTVRFFNRRDLSAGRA